MFLNKILIESIVEYDNESQAIQRVQNSLTTVMQNGMFKAKAAKYLIAEHGIKFPEHLHGDIADYGITYERAEELRNLSEDNGGIL